MSSSSRPQALVLAWWLGASSLLGCTVLTPPVTRTVDGVATEGRFIEPEAYALYAVAALREATGKQREALELYQKALAVDSRGPEIRTRIGALACRLREQKLADETFEAALGSDPEYGPAWFELALCRRSRADLAGAASAAERALELDPERYETSLLAADLAEQRGDHGRAWQLRDALSTHATDSLQVQRALLDAAQRAKHPARVARAEQALIRLGRHRPEQRAPRGAARALDLLSRGEVATARREAELVLAADPGNGDALVIALSAADLEQDHAGFTRLLRTTSEPGRPASPAVLVALQALLARRVSAQAAQLLSPQ